MGQVWGYARVSTEDQELGLQIDALRAAGVPEANVVEEKASGKAGSDRPLYEILLGRLRDGDKLVVWKVDRLGRSTLDALQTAKDLDARGVAIVITTLGVDLSTPAGRLVFGMMAQIAEFERELIRERVKAGMAAAKARGIHVGRKRALSPHQRQEAARMHSEGQSFAQIGATLGVPRSVAYRAAEEARGASEMARKDFRDFLRKQRVAGTAVDEGVVAVLRAAADETASASHEAAVGLAAVAQCGAKQP